MQLSERLAHLEQLGDQRIVRDLEVIRLQLARAESKLLVTITRPLLRGESRPENRP